MRRFLIGLVVISALAGAQTIAQAPQMTQAQIDEFRKGAVEAGKNGVTHPVVVREYKPLYSSDAMREKLQGSVSLEVVVNADGRVGPVRVVKSLDTIYGLDQAAVDAAKRWTFRPATKDGRPVASYVQLELEFRLHEDFRR